jgi:phosphate-selective porin
MAQCENGKVGISIADHTTAGELAARYSIVSLNSDIVPGSESITGAIYGGQQQFATLALSWHPSDWLRFISKIWT